MKDSQPELKKLTDREHILLRPAIYIGSVDYNNFNEFIINNNKIEYKETEYISGLLKIINEIIDNSVDAIIRHNFKIGDSINVKIDSNSVTVEDNGSGIPVRQNSENEYMPFLAWGHAKAGSNFDDSKGRTTIGLNGLGSYLTNVWSKKFIGETHDSNKCYKVEFKNNAQEFKESLSDSTEHKTIVKFWPDLERFKIKEITEVHRDMIYQRLLNLAICFPNINFKFNNKLIKFKSFKNYISLFGDNAIIYETQNIKLAILPNPYDDFKHFSYVNGLKIPDGGTHIDEPINKIVSGIREKLIKKYKNIKPGDIKNKLMFVEIVSDFPNPKFNSQTKEKITNSAAEFNKFASIDYSFIDKILKSKDIIDPIIDIFKLKEELEAKKALKSVEKVKKIKSDKYFKATKENKYLMITEGQSAFGGISSILGNSEFAYYCLKGKPLNAWDISHQKFASNKELSELFQIIKNSNFQNIIITSDKDLDGNHINGLILGFIEKYLPEYKSRIGRLNTPIKANLKNGKPVSWVYDVKIDLPKKQGEIQKYYKGLGSWDPETLGEIIKKDRLENMIEMYDFSNSDYQDTMDDFLGESKADRRKEYIKNHKFSIVSL